MMTLHDLYMDAAGQALRLTRELAAGPAPEHRERAVQVLPYLAGILSSAASHAVEGAALDWARDTDEACALTAPQPGDGDVVAELDRLRAEADREARELADLRVTVSTLIAQHQPVPATSFAEVDRCATCGPGTSWPCPTMATITHKLAPDFLRGGLVPPPRHSAESAAELTTDLRPVRR